MTSEVTPHHLYFNDEALTSFDTNLKVAPPIRTENDRKTLIEAIKDGTIDCIATDHAPHTIQDKETTFDLAAFGMIGLESCFGSVKKVLVDQEKLSLEDLIVLLTQKPRETPETIARWPTAVPCADRARRATGPGRRCRGAAPAWSPGPAPRFP